MNKEIIIPEGWEIDLKKSGNGKVVLREVEKPKTKTWREVQEIAAGNKTKQYFITGRKGVRDFKMCEDGIIFSYNHLPTSRAAEKIAALCQMYILADYYNREYADGWVANWENEDQYKYVPKWNGYLDKIDHEIILRVSDVLPAFASAKILMDCYNNNKEVFEAALKP